MRVIIQRVSEAELRIDDTVFSSIEAGLLILLGIEEADNSEDIIWLSRKISSMRIFSDHEDKMNLSVADISGEILVVSQFTLHASTKKGNRPSFIKAAKPGQAKILYEAFISQLKEDSGLNIKTGVFGAMMDINLVNSGPVTIFMDSKNKE